MSAAMGEDDRRSFMEKIISLCKRRGFIFQSSDIYGGLNGFFDYGPLGVELKKNIKDAWWSDMVRRRKNIIGLDCSIISHPNVWKASGHIAGFSDPMVDCKESKMRFRADQLFFARVSAGGTHIGYVSVLESPDAQQIAEDKANSLRKKLAAAENLDPLILRPYAEISESEYALIPSPITDNPGSLTLPRDFNLMFKTHVGALSDSTSVAYLRPETAQGIFTNFKNVLDSTRIKIPFGIAQIGRSFRNEITPRNFIFRSREFEQMELEFFIDDREESWQKWYEYWVSERLNWHKNIGLPGDMLGLDVHKKDKLAHYAKACTDITFKYPFGVQELEGIAARGCFDLKQHQLMSGQSMEYFDESEKRKFIPHVIEPSAGVDRTLLAVLCAAYGEDEIGSEKRVVMKFSPRIAPIKLAILPIVKNRNEIVTKARDVYAKIQNHWNVYYDEGGAIGRRYRRMDEVGTPFCLTVDFDSLANGTFTVRFRDTAEQVRLHENEIIGFLAEKCT
ncbi:MAG: glycine--tRNA ligase [Puniceicoccales bacterium]|jgi:glycyl-tRNA synthetase|nr:glycine--tRNA ligase [Puniceicoccales bacterium]